VRRGATQSEVNAAAKRLQFAHHPDKGGDGQLVALVNAAADVLKDPVRRACYDQWLRIGGGTAEAARNEASDAAERSRRREAQAEAAQWEATREAREQEQRERRQREEEEWEAAREAREQEQRERRQREEEERQEWRRRYDEDAAKEAKQVHRSGKEWRRRTTKGERFPFVPEGLRETERVGNLWGQWRRKKMYFDHAKDEQTKARLKAEMDGGWAEAAGLRDRALDTARASRFPRCTPGFKRERPEDAEVVGQLFKRYRAAKARGKYHKGLDGAAAGEERELCREAWRVQLGTAG
jgi:curved DNA-binding protein CbpA